MDEVRWEGLDRSRQQIDALVEAVRVATPGGVDAIMKRTQRQAKTLLSLGWHEPGTPTGSRPGEPPWRISGRLRGSVAVSPPRRIGDKWRGRVGAQGGAAPGTRYGRIQELGGVTGWRHRTRLPPRPWLKPAWRIVRPSIAHLMAERWDRATHSVLR